MIQISYYHEHLDWIFFELERFSCFRIDYSTVARTVDSGDAFILESVNRIKYPEVFASALEKILTGVRARLMAEMRMIPSQELPLFFDEILQRYLGLKKLVIEPGRMPSSTIRSWDISGDIFLFNPNGMYRGAEPESKEKIPVSVLAQASDFARTWMDQIEEAIARTRALHAAAELGSGFGSKDCSPLTGKIVLNCSVHRLGLHLKLLFEEDFFPGTSKMELCKAITKFFSTVNQPDISFRSLKNAMDAPREQALEMFMEKWVGYLDKATDMKVMN